MTDFEDNRHLGSPPPSKRRSSPIAGAEIREPPRSFSLREINLRSVCDVMVARGIKLLALDWDLTLVSCHTGGRWYGNGDELSKQIRPVFRDLINHAVASGLRIAVVSFSGQNQLIREALAAVFPKYNFIVRCSDKQWNVSDASLQQYFPGIGKGSPAKLKHVFSVVEQLNHANKENGVEVAPHNIVLIDDDPKNVEHARQNNLTAIQMLPNHPHHFLHDLQEAFPS